jgi:hypothetical protein
MDRTQTPKLIFGGLAAAMGVFAVCEGLDLIPHAHSDPTIPLVQQQAVGVCVGLVFVAGGVAAALTAFPNSAAARLANRVLGFVVIVGLTLLMAWVAVGPGARPFSGSMAMFGPKVNAISGRIMFGVAALVGLFITVMMALSLRKGPARQ